MKTENHVKKQLKFAVVMYGGGSLAIYINGVAQELLRLSHATNPVEPDSFDGTTRVYRKIALLLSGNSAAVEEIEKLRKSKDSGTSVDDAIKAELKKATNVEFIIDVLTGSSAGGINSVFLAKALVNGSKNMTDLQKLWLEQGDFAKLLNDRKSVADNGLNTPIEPASLLNSQRMYLELLKALDGLDESASSSSAMKQPIGTPIPAKQPIDLYVTYTDFEGLPTNLALADKTVLERVHKRVFKFRADRSGGHDFGHEMNPFLAFAARCTSSFPFAFEPMKLTNIDEIIDTHFPLHGGGRSDNKKWLDYFDDLTDEHGRPVDWKKRWFVDGGCLDNKPFGYAIDKLSQSAGEGIVERKLIYVEPNPERFRPSKDAGKQPNALENVFAQASGLPSYETIREDLRRVLDRNRLIERVNRLTAEVEEDFTRNRAWLNAQGERRRRDIDWSTADLGDVGTEKGPAFVPYYRLRVGATTDEIARLVTRFFQIDIDSDYFKALRRLVRIWREDTYRDYRSPDGRETLNKFLYDFDVDYRLRRLRFILQKTDYMLRCREEVFRDLARYRSEVDRKDLPDRDERELVTKAAEEVIATGNGVLPSKEAVIAAIPGYEADDKKRFVAEFDSHKYVDAVLKIQEELTTVYRDPRNDNGTFLKYLAAEAKSRDESIPANSSIPGLSEFRRALRSVAKDLVELERQHIRAESVSEIREQPSIVKRTVERVWGKDASDAEAEEKALQASALNRILRHFTKLDKRGCSEADNVRGENILSAIYPGQGDNIWELFESLSDAAAVLNTQILNEESSFLRKASSGAKKVLGIRGFSRVDESPSTADRERSPEAEFVEGYLRPYYQLFDSYDQISLPVFFETPVGEAVPVDVIRISSRDAHSLINEEDPKEDRRKLAGDYLFAFGAFLDPRWRLNDIMWGRLDGAERLITTLIPDDLAEYRAPFIEEANQIIIEEMLLANATSTFRGSVVDALTLASSESKERNAVVKLSRKVTTLPIRDDLAKALTVALSRESLCGQIKSGYEVDRRLEPKPTLETISRSTQIIGHILQRVADEKAQAGDRIKWVTRLGQVFWGLVTVAAPNGILNSLFNYWIQLLYLFEVLLLIGGTLFANQEVQQLSIIFLILTLGLHLSVMALQETMLGDVYWKKLFRFLLVGVLAVFVVAGGVFLFAAFFNPWTWGKIVELQTLFAQQDFNRWRKLMFISPFAILIIVLALWREAHKLNLKIVGRAIIVGFIAMLGLSVYFSSLTRAKPGEAPLIELEFVQTTQALREVISRSDADGLTSALWIDSLVFVPLYLGFLLLLSTVLRRRRHRLAFWLGILAGVLAIVGAVADWAENYFSLAALHSGQTDGSILVAAQIKWAAVFGAVGLLSAIFWRRELKNWWNALAAVIAGLSGFGIAMTFIDPVPYVPTILGLVLVVWFVAGVLFQFDKLRRSFLRFF